MRIALLNIQYYPNIEGGAEISTQKLAEELSDKNEVYVICNGTYTGEFEEINNVKVIRMSAIKPFHNKIQKVIAKLNRSQSVSLLRGILADIKPDVLHTNNLHAFSVIVWKVAYELDIPIIHTLRDYSLLYTTFKCQKWIHKYFSYKVSVVTAPSRYTLNEFLKGGFFKKASKCVVVPNAIDIDWKLYWDNYRIKMKEENSVVKFAFIGRYTMDKGIDWLVSVFDKMNINAELHLFGKGDLLNETTEIISSNSRIYNHGFLNQTQLCNELKNIDVVVVPSLWDEPFGRVILDAYKNVCPVIITNRGGMPEIVDNESTGLILSDTIDKCLEESILYFTVRGNIKNMLPNIEKKLVNYSIGLQANSFMELYESTIAQNNHI
jgi:glycosyltransferase involved in cell wall biosynthesis